MTPPDPFIPRYLRRGARERIDYARQRADAAGRGGTSSACCDDFRAEGVQAVAVALLWSIAERPSTSARSARSCAASCRTPRSMICSDILPMIREWRAHVRDRALGAYIKPGISRYLERPRARARSAPGLQHPLLIMQATGGTSTIPEIQRRPVYAMGSGPAAGPAAGAAALSSFGIDDFIAADMGGTSFDVGDR